MGYANRVDKFMAATGLTEVYRVGGSVRDELLGRKAKDCDYVVREATLIEIGVALNKAGAKITPLKLRDGRQIGWRANKKGLGLVEIAMPRTEVARERKANENQRHAFEIITNPNLSLADDSKRRDFTINALYKRIPTGEIIDPTGVGQRHIQDKCLETTHYNSFRDDPLRILRALRFRATLGFPLTNNAYAQMEDHAAEVTGLTAKGVSGTALSELCKLLMGRHVAAALKDMRDTGVMAAFLPELAPMIGFEQGSKYHDLTTDEHTFAAIDAAANLNCSLRVRMALLFHDCGKPESSWLGEDGHLHYYENPELGKEDHALIGRRLANRALKRLNAEKKLINDVTRLVERHMVPLTVKTKPTKVRKWRTELGDELLADLFKHRLCDILGKETIDYSAMEAIARLEQIRSEAQRQGVPTSAHDLEINGHDLMDLGLQGRDIGNVQKQLLHEVVSQPDRNDREWLLGRAAKLAKK